jgi:hypothetical protein
VKGGECETARKMEKDDEEEKEEEDKEGWRADSSSD